MMVIYNKTVETSKVDMIITSLRAAYKNVRFTINDLGNGWSHLLVEQY